MKVNIISTAPPTKCGIGITNHCLMKGMQEFFKTEDLNSKGINLCQIEKPQSKNPLYFIRLAWKSRRADLIHVQYNHDCFGTINKNINGFQNILFYPMLKLFSKPLVTTFHEVTDLSGASVIRKFFYRILNFCPLRMSDHIIVTTDLAKQLVMNQDNISEHKISVIPLGTFKNYKKIDKDIAKHMLGIPLSHNVVTLFGFIDTNKGHDKILDILSTLNDNTTFLIAGSPRSQKGEDYLKFLKEKISSENLHSKVLFYGFVKEQDQQKIISASDLIVYPYSDITSSLSLSTAISYQIPILTSDIRPFKDFFDTHHCTIISNVNNKKELSKKIKLLLKDKQSTSRLLLNQKAFIGKFNWEEIARQTIDVYYSKV